MIDIYPNLSMHYTVAENGLQTVFQNRNHSQKNREILDNIQARVN